MDNPCANCQGPFHSATGHHLSDNVFICQICAGRFFGWVVSHTRNKSKRPRAGEKPKKPDVGFYDAAMTSNIPKVDK